MSNSQALERVRHEFESQCCCLPVTLSELFSFCELQGSLSCKRASCWLLGECDETVAIKHWAESLWPSVAQGMWF